MDWKAPGGCYSTAFCLPCISPHAGCDHSMHLRTFVRRFPDVLFWNPTTLLEKAEVVESSLPSIYKIKFIGWIPWSVEGVLLLYQFTRRAIKPTVIIIVGYHCYQIHTNFIQYPLKIKSIHRMSQEQRSIFREVIGSVSLSKQSVYVHVSYSERFPR
jgi:hypothetical protein